MVGRPRAAWTDQAKLCAPQAPAACAGPAPVPAQTGGESGDRTDRLLKLLETANIKLASVVTDVFGVSGLLMLRALVEGRATPSETAQLARGLLRKKVGDLELALEGRLEEHHRFLLNFQLRRLGPL